MLFLIAAFIAGVLTVLAPCVLPLLPVIIGGSMSGNVKDKRRPFLIAASLAVSLLIFTVLLKATAVLIAIPPQVITYISGGIIIILGLATLFPLVYAKIIAKLGIETRAMDLLGAGRKNHSQWLGPIIIGAALGPVFSSCSPVYAYILATVLPVNFGIAMLYIVSYVLGLALVMLAIGYYGQRVTSRLRFASNPDGIFQRTLGAIFIFVGILIITGVGTQLQVFLANHTPLQFDSFSASLIPKQDGSHATDDTKLYNVDAYKAPELTGIQSWLNSNPQTLASLKGKVVLIDFWTYTCINCIRSLPYTEGWYNTYKKDGLVVIGVEAPEFAYEKIPSNVAAAVKQDGLTYPIAIDGDLQTWRAYKNQYWPAEYLIDRNGQVRRQAFGEGDYDQTEQAIRGLLTEDGKTKLTSTLVAPSSVTVPVTNDQTPETYFGTDRADAYEGTPALKSSNKTYTFADELDDSYWSLSGNWSVSGSSITSGNNAKLRISVAAKDVYLVGGASNATNVGVQFNGQPINDAGSISDDVKDSHATIQLSNLYRIASFKSFTNGILELDVPSGVTLNTLTFGS